MVRSQKVFVEFFKFYKYLVVVFSLSYFAFFPHSFKIFKFERFLVKGQV